MKKVLYVLPAFLLFLGSSFAQLTLKSNDLSGQASAKEVFNGFGCTGENISPQLYWENAPAGTKSFAVTMYDGDAPTGSGWWHWLVFDLDKGISELPAGAGDPSSDKAPQGAIQSRTDYGAEGYGGPCPPEGHGFHRYVITVYALGVDKLGPDKTASPALIGYFLEQNVIEKASLVFYHKR
ncbi:MAG: YbhB/YbcL family Raf kinase inhibitor-like protein [Bacteroidota bacterium]